MRPARRELDRALTGAALLAAACIGVGGASAVQVSRTTVTPASGRAAVRYVANAGVLVEAEGASFLIDAPIRDGLVPYATSPIDERAHLEQATGPYANVDAILITHFTSVTPIRGLTTLLPCAACRKPTSRCCLSGICRRTPRGPWFAM